MASNSKIDIRDLSFNELIDFLKSINEPPYRARQIFSQLYFRRESRDFKEMSELPESLRSKLKNRFYIYKAKVLEKQVSKLDKTAKYIIKLEDGNLIETVLIKHKDRNTLCVSTQVGCRFKCRFCASGVKGFLRNLKCSEILEQFLTARNDLAQSQIINNVVFMGMGEPLDNFENLTKAIKILNSKNGLDVGMRKITISTCGLVDRINKLMLKGKAPELSISLHAPNDRIRNRLMPINRKFNIESLLKIAKEYIDKTKRLVTFEYILIDGINDSVIHVNELSKILERLRCKLNLIPYNEVGSFKFHTARESNVRRFYNTLKKNKISVTLRDSRGKDIDAACGQLRLRYEVSR